MYPSLSHLEELEAEAIFVIREAAAQFENPVILFSGGKDSILLSHLAVKAFSPARVPFPLLHIDTGHNFEETLLFRDHFAEKLGLRLLIGSVQEAIDRGVVMEENGVHASRIRLQTTVLVEMLEKHSFDAALGGGRRDEEKARAKERFFSHRDEFSQWDPKNQRPELWNLFNGKKHTGEHFRIFPISNWTELDVWQYLDKEKIELPKLYFAHHRRCVKRKETWLAYSDLLSILPGENVVKKQIRFRTIGDMTCTGALESTAKNIPEVIAEIAASRQTERGTRTDDQRSENSMEDRKVQGYF